MVLASLLLETLKESPVELKDYKHWTGLASKMNQEDLDLELQDRCRLVASGFAVSELCLSDLFTLNSDNLAGVLDLTKDAVTASSGIEALADCIDVLGNRNSYPVVDQIAMEGIELIVKNLKKACVFHDQKAKEKVALGSAYASLSVKLVKPSAIQAIANALNRKYQVDVAFAKAILLPILIDYNYSEAPKKYAKLSLVLGARMQNTEKETAAEGTQAILNLINECELPADLSGCDISKDDIIDIAYDIMNNDKQLLTYNVREISLTNIIYLILKCSQCKLC